MKKTLIVFMPFISKQNEFSWKTKFGSKKMTQIFKISRDYF